MTWRAVATLPDGRRVEMLLPEGPDVSIAHDAHGYRLAWTDGRTMDFASLSEVAAYCMSGEDAPTR